MAVVVESRTRGPEGAGKTLGELARPFFDACEEDADLGRHVSELELSPAQSTAVMGLLTEGLWGEGTEGELGSEGCRALEWATRNPPRQNRQEEVPTDDGEATEVVVPVDLSRPYDNDWEIERVSASNFGDSIDLRDSSGLRHPSPTDAEAEAMQAALQRIAPKFATPEDHPEPRFPVFFTFAAENDNLGCLETGGIVLETPTKGCFFMTQYYYD
jgi:hypothetical protein